MAIVPFLLSLLICHAHAVNFIVMQPDDFAFFAEWTPPAVFPGDSAQRGWRQLGNLTRLRDGGVQMMRAHAAAPICGPSRYTTITGRYASRMTGEEVSNPNIQLEGEGCTRYNLAALLQQNNFKTGIVGKWHLDDFDYPEYYRRVVNKLEGCGFDHAFGIYPHNYAPRTTGLRFSHNTEYLTAKAIEFIDIAVEENKEFFLYFNPSAAHRSGNVYDALTQYSCRDTPEGYLDSEPIVPGMTETVGDDCRAYRQSVINRAHSTENRDLGAVWIDDAVGALFRHLEEVNRLRDTFFLFQLDHGLEGKGTVYEPGSRIAQFVHYPRAIRPGTQFDGLVSTVDIGPTILDYAGITRQSPGWYPMDGMSWRSAVKNSGAATIGTVSGDAWSRRCVVVEMERVRSVTCGCDKLLRVRDPVNSRTVRRGNQMRLVTDDGALLNLCDSDGSYVTSPANSIENQSVYDPDKQRVLEGVLDCHMRMTMANIGDYGACQWA